MSILLDVLCSYKTSPQIHCRVTVPTFIPCLQSVLLIEHDGLDDNAQAFKEFFLIWLLLF